jgi:DNA-directed RNA polymerase subunit E'/Rpb7
VVCISLFPSNSIHPAVVRRVQPYGIFVDLEGFSRNGLVHNSQVDEMLEFQVCEPPVADVHIVSF